MKNHPLMIALAALALFGPKHSRAADYPPLAIGKGAFVSFADGVLTLEGSLGSLQENRGKKETVVWKNIDENTRVYLATGEDRGDPDRGYRQVPALESLKNVKPGTFVFVGPWFGYQDRPGFFVGINRAFTVGTFVSYTTGSKNSGLSLLSVETKPSTYTKKYGNSLFIRGIPENTPVEESIDGGPYQPAGTVKTALPEVKEGTLVTVHSQGEGKTILIQLGMPEKKK